MSNERNSDAKPDMISPDSFMNEIGHLSQEDQ